MKNMGEAKERRSRAMENISLEMEKYPRDLLQRFMVSSSSSSSNNVQQQQAGDTAAADEEGDLEEVELNLGLSLGGRFGIDKDAKKKLMRSSSIAGTVPLIREEKATVSPPPVSYPSLIRTSSLPTETEEEWRKRKELQTLRRMEAKRRRSEKQRSTTRAERESSSLEEEPQQQQLQQQEQQHGFVSNTMNSKAVPPFGLPTWAAAARQAVLGGGGDVMSKGKVGFLGGQNTSQGSMETHGGSSSGMSDLESKPAQGSSSCGEARSPASNQLLQERSNQDMLGSSGTKSVESAYRSLKLENPSKKPSTAENRGRESGMNTMEDMPCVFTKGDGPNGRRIEGILYRYGKGEEVRIMCVCHGKFLSPAEFVKHAGGSDVTNPLRHIVVNPSSTPFS